MSFSTLRKLFVNAKKQLCSRSITLQSKYIIYRIVNSTNTKYIVQCIGTNSIFHLQFDDIVSNIDILNGLHPIQACNLGIQYAKYLAQSQLPLEEQKLKVNQFNQTLLHRYGNYKLRSQDRHGNICFLDIQKKEQVILTPQEIVDSKAIIKQFDANHAFYIGIAAGLRGVL